MINGCGSRVPPQKSCRRPQDRVVLLQAAHPGLQGLDLLPLAARHPLPSAGIDPGLSSPAPHRLLRDPQLGTDRRTRLGQRPVLDDLLGTIRTARSFVAASKFLGIPASFLTRNDAAQIPERFITVTLDRPDTPRIARALTLLTDELGATPAHIPGDRRPITYHVSPTA